MELFKASNQWSTRPDDERFWDLEEMRLACAGYKARAATSTVRYRDLRVEAAGPDLRLIGKTGVPARISHYAFGQLAQRAGAPAEYVRGLPATLASQCVNHGLKTRADDNAASLLWHQNGDLLLRAATSTIYQRIWNADIVDRLSDLDGGWRTAPAFAARPGDGRTRVATEADIVRGGVVKVGTKISPAGLYASDHDMFVFMINEDRIIDDGTEAGLARGFFLWNSEVGDKSFGVMQFKYKYVCGNHIVWGAQDVSELRVRHVGAHARSRALRNIKLQIKQYANESASDEEAQIKSAQRYQLGATKDEVIDAVLGISKKRRLQIPKRDVVDAYAAAERGVDQYGSPRTAWGMVNGLTEISQRSKHADRRNRLDRAAGKIMEVAF